MGYAIDKDAQLELRAPSKDKETLRCVMITRRLLVASSITSLSLPALAQTWPTLTAARIPLGIPKSSENDMATVASNSELGNRDR